MHNFCSFKQTQVNKRKLKPQNNTLSPPVCRHVSHLERGIRLNLHLQLQACVLPCLGRGKTSKTLKHISFEVYQSSVDAVIQN